MNEAIGNQFGVKKSKAQANATQLGLTAVKQEVAEFLETLSDDSDSESDSEDETPAFDDGPIGSDEPQFVEVFREKTIEDIIEEQRAKLAAEGKKGTPVTEESFAKWRAEKLLKRQAEAEARLKSEQTKKKGGKGLCKLAVLFKLVCLFFFYFFFKPLSIAVLSGKELFNYNASLFVDDESAFDTSNDKALNAEMKALQEKEELQIKEEYERAQAEQMRLFEIQKAEMDARRYREEDRRNKAVAPDRITFVFNGIIINQIVFEEDDDEDLELFADEPYLPNIEQQMTENQENEMSNLMKELNIHDQKVRLQRREKELEQEEEEEIDEGDGECGEDEDEGNSEGENGEDDNAES